MSWFEHSLVTKNMGLHIWNSDSKFLRLLTVDYLLWSIPTMTCIQLQTSVSRAFWKKKVNPRQYYFPLRVIYSVMFIWLTAKQTTWIARNCGKHESGDIWLETIPLSWSDRTKLGDSLCCLDYNTTLFLKMWWLYPVSIQTAH